MNVAIDADQMAAVWGKRWSRLKRFAVSAAFEVFAQRDEVVACLRKFRAGRSLEAGENVIDQTRGLTRLRPPHRNADGSTDEYSVRRH